MKFYNLTNKEMPWGDYGDILLTGMTSHLDRHNGVLQYERTGPFQPDIIISGVDDLLVTDSFKKKIERSTLRGFQFKPVTKRHISYVDWATWNLQKEDPEFYPESGEPEDYILGLPHSQNLADRMEAVWEIIVQANGRYRDDNSFQAARVDLDIMRPSNKGYFIVTEIAKIWFEQNSEGWVQFLTADNHSI